MSLMSGPTMVTACRSDPRFSYCMYLPPRNAGRKTRPDLVVAVHGSLRPFMRYRDALSAFGRWNHCAILCPLFPAGVHGDGYGDGYKYLLEGDLRYDQLLLSMVDEVTAEHGLDGTRFGLFGYSGGAHLAHRFYTLHPDRLWAVSIGAPGSVTLLDWTRDWWVGVRNTQELFNVQVAPAVMRKVPVQMIVGQMDLETHEIVHHEGERSWMPGANDSGRNRPERLARLRDSYAAHDIAVRFDVVPDVAHDGLRCAQIAEDFLAEVLARRRESIR
ncbi:MAG: alpha/beta hydrolase [Pseudomonadota bacterium]|nr:alpha/beta hydrolase [Pseudomonadota bacterium]